MRTICRAARANRQRGAVLILSMVLLMVISLLGINSVTNTQLELRMAASFAANSELRQAANSVVVRAIDGDFAAPEAVDWQVETLPAGVDCAPGRWRSRRLGRSASQALDGRIVEAANFEIEAECASADGRSFRIVTGASYRADQRLVDGVE